jgi:hypothetical protein
MSEPAGEATVGGGEGVAEIVDRVRAEGAQVLAAAEIPFASFEEDVAELLAAIDRATESA